MDLFLVLFCRVNLLELIKKAGCLCLPGVHRTNTCHAILSQRMWCDRVKGGDIWRRNELLSILKRSTSVFVCPVNSAPNRNVPIRCSTAVRANRCSFNHAMLHTHNGRCNCAVHACNDGKDPVIRSNNKT